MLIRRSFPSLCQAQLRPRRKLVIRRSCSSTASQGQSLLSGIDAVWPAQDSSPETQFKRAAAQYLVAQVECRGGHTQISNHLSTSIGTRKQLGIVKDFNKLFQADPYFLYEGYDLSKSNHITKLNVTALIQAAGRGEALTLPSVKQVLQFVHSMKWHDTCEQLDVLRRELALHIVQQANAEQQTAGAAVNINTQSYVLDDAEAGRFIASTLQKNSPGEKCSFPGSAAVTGGSLCLSTYSYGTSKPFVHLNILRLLQDMLGASVPLPPLLLPPPKLKPPETSVAVAETSAQQQKPTHGTDAADTEAAAAAATDVSAQQLLEFVCGMEWHADPETDALRRGMAVHAVLKAHDYDLPGIILANRPANLDPPSYQLDKTSTGAVLVATWDALFESRQGFKGIFDKFAGDLYWAVTHSQEMKSLPQLQLDIKQIVRDTQHSKPHATADGQQQGYCMLQPSAAAQAQQLSVRQVLLFLLKRKWNDNPQLDYVQRALAAYIVVHAHGYQVAGLAHDGSFLYAPGKHRVTGALAGYILQRALSSRFPSITPPYKSLRAALSGNPFFLLHFSTPSVLEVHLDLEHTLSAMGISAGSIQQLQDSSTAADAFQQLRLKPMQLHASNQEQQQGLQQSELHQQQQEQQEQEHEMWQHAQLIDVMPLPSSMQLLSKVRPADCAAAEVITVSEQSQHAQLQQLLQHLEAAKIAALDMEFGREAWDDNDKAAASTGSNTAASSSSNSYSNSSFISSEDGSDDEGDETVAWGPAAEQQQSSSRGGSSSSSCALNQNTGRLRQPKVQNRHQQQLSTAVYEKMQLALLQFMVPAVPAMTQLPVAADDTAADCEVGTGSNRAAGTEAATGVAAVDAERTAGTETAMEAEGAAGAGTATTAEVAATRGDVAVKADVAPAAGTAADGEQQAYVSWPAAVYIVEVPEDAAAAQQLMLQLQPVLEDEGVVKVLHDSRLDSGMLQHFFKINLRAVLDTQLLAGLQRLAAASNHSSSSGNSDGGGSSSNSSMSASEPRGSRSWQTLLARPRLAGLYEEYGFTHSQKDQNGGRLNKKPRMWFRRPLSARAVEYAADDVRYLLPLAYCLLQQLPQAVMNLADLQMLVAQQGTAALQLRQQLLPHYHPLLWPMGVGQQHGSRATAVGGWGPGQSYEHVLFDTLPAFKQEQLVHMLFELQLERQPGGWYTPRFGVYLHEQQQQQQYASETTVDTAESEGESEAESAVAVMDAEAKWLAEAAADGGKLKASAAHLGGSDNSGGSGGSGGSGDSGSIDSIPTGTCHCQPVMDDAAESLMALLPQSVHAHLMPYLTLDSPGQPLVVQAMADAGSNLQLRMSDHTMFELRCSLDITEALACITAAQQQQQQQQQQPAMQPAVQHAQNLLVAAQDKKHSSSSLQPSCEHTDLSASSSSTSTEQQQQPALAPAAAVDWPAHFSACSNRYKVPGTLHEVSALNDLQGQVFGLTYHVGRHIPGAALTLADVLSSMKASIRQPGAADCRPQSLLLLGRPGVGKTTLLRDIARLMSLPPDQGGLGLAVMVVDTLGDITGCLAKRHPGLGAARRIVVPQRSQQAAVLLDVLHNHAPDVIIVDDIGAAEEELDAAAAISQHGVLLVAATASNSLPALLRDPQRRRLLMGTHAQQESQLSAAAVAAAPDVDAAPFATLLEVQERNRWRLHLDVESSLAAAGGSVALSSQPHHCNAQLRIRDPSSGRVIVQFNTPAAAEQALDAAKVVAAAAASCTGASSDLHVLLPMHRNAPGSVGSNEAVVAVRNKGRAHSGGWLVDLVHAAVHRAVQSASDGWYASVS